MRPAVLQSSDILRLMIKRILLFLALASSALAGPGVITGGAVPASQVSFTPTGTSSTATTQDAINRAKAVNVQTDFGAKGDGSTDDQAAINSAAVAAIAQHRNLYIPGSATPYKISAEIAIGIGASGLTIFGDGADVSILNQVTAGSHGIHFLTTGSVYENIHVQGIQIQGPGIGTSTADGILCESQIGGVSERFLFDQVWINGFAVGFRGTNLASFTWDVCDISNSAVNFYVDGTASQNNTVRGTLIGGENTGSVTGMHLSGGNGWILDNIETGGTFMTQGFIFDGADAITIRGGTSDVFITSGYFIDHRYSAKKLSVINHTFNQMAGSGATGIQVGGGAYLFTLNNSNALSTGLYAQVSGGSIVSSQEGNNFIGPTITAQAQTYQVVSEQGNWDTALGPQGIHFKSTNGNNDFLNTFDFIGNDWYVAYSRSAGLGPWSPPMYLDASGNHLVLGDDTHGLHNYNPKTLATATVNVVGSIRIGGAQGATSGGSSTSGATYTGTKITNIRHGISGAMTSGTVTVSDIGCTANTRYFFTAHTLGTVTFPSAFYASTRTSGTSIVITASQITDTSTVDWEAIEP